MQASARQAGASRESTTREAIPSKKSPFSSASCSPLERSNIDESKADLQLRYRRDGYLFFPGALNRELTEPLLQAMLAVLDPHIVWSKALRAPVLRGEPFFESDPLWDELYPKIQALESLHAVFHHPQMRTLMQVVAGEDPFVYPMKMARIAAPRKLGFETPPHQDAHSHHTGPRMAGVWVGLHHADQSMGRLAILPGSHRRGVRPVHQAKGVGGIQCVIYPDETHWHVSDVEPGDVILFQAQTVHRAQPNTGAERVRLSVDSRFCDYGAPVFSTNLEPHHGWRIPELSWGSVYQNWSGETPKYYWRNYPALF
ncbi:MAG: phytanoyl-CoA dioxygenase family protein [Pseudomonadota bacterium]